MFQMRPIGSVRSPYQATAEVPKGLGVKHQAEGVIEILPEFELGLQDVEGFSHLFVVWVFDRTHGVALIGRPPTDDRPHGVFATRSPRRPNPIGLTVVELIKRVGAQLHVRGIDMLDGTPILDIKLYSSSIPMETAAAAGLPRRKRKKTIAGVESWQRFKSVLRRRTMR